MDGVQLQDGQALPQRHRFTLDDAIAMNDAGVFPPDSRIELIDGELLDMMPIGPEHNGIVSGLNHALVAACAGDKGIVRVQSTLRLGPYDAPESDFAVVAHRRDFYARRHPGPADTFVVMEVAEASLQYDNTVKLPMYARASIPECWIVNLKAKELRSFRNPAGDAYAEPTVHNAGEHLALAAAPGVLVRLDLFFA